MAIVEQDLRLSNSASDAGELPGMLKAVTNSRGLMPKQVLADTGYKSEAVFEALDGSGCDIVVALAREGRAQMTVGAQRLPRTAALADKLLGEPGRQAYRRRKWLAEPPVGGSSNVPGAGNSACAGLTRSEQSGGSTILNECRLVRRSSGHPPAWIRTAPAA